DRDVAADLRPGREEAGDEARAVAVRADLDVVARAHHLAGRRGMERAALETDRRPQHEVARALAALRQCDGGPGQPGAQFGRGAEVGHRPDNSSRGRAQSRTFSTTDLAA